MRSGRTLPLPGACGFKHAAAGYALYTGVAGARMTWTEQRRHALLHPPCRPMRASSELQCLLVLPSYFTHHSYSVFWTEGFRNTGCSGKSSTPGCSTQGWSGQRAAHVLRLTCAIRTVSTCAGAVQLV